MAAAVVQSASPRSISLPGGRRLPSRGDTARDIDITNPEVRALIDDGLLDVVHDFDVTAAKVDDVAEWVGDDPARAVAALAAERTRPERDQRSTLIDRLEQLVDTTNQTHPEEA